MAYQTVAQAKAFLDKAWTELSECKAVTSLDPELIRLLSQYRAAEHFLQEAYEVEEACTYRVTFNAVFANKEYDGVHYVHYGIGAGEVVSDSYMMIF